MCPFGMFGRKKDARAAEKTEAPEDTAPQAETEGSDKRPGLLGRLRAGLSKTRSKVLGGLCTVLSMHKTLDDELIEEIEEQLFIADVGPKTVVRLTEELRDAHRKGEIDDPSEVIEFLKNHIVTELRKWDTDIHLSESGPGVIMVAGVNGSGKTTSIAKLARLYVQQGKKVLLAACDTFRAAAIDQLAIWAHRTGADIVKNESADPAAVAFDAAEKAVAQGYDVLIIDTAGRLHTRRNLMDELNKISRVVRKKIDAAPHETIMVLDATTGQNAISQAIKFHESIELTGLILTKLDGTAKGGVVFGMRDQVDLPVKFIGIGEQMNDMIPFEPEAFVAALFE